MLKWAANIILIFDFTNDFTMNLFYCAQFYIYCFTNE